MDEAMNNLKEGMKGTMAYYTSVVIKETPIMDVYPYTTEIKS